MLYSLCAATLSPPLAASALFSFCLRRRRTDWVARAVRRFELVCFHLVNGTMYAKPPLFPIPSPLSQLALPSIGAVCVRVCSVGASCRAAQVDGPLALPFSATRSVQPRVFDPAFVCVCVRVRVYACAQRGTTWALVAAFGDEHRGKRCRQRSGSLEIRLASSSIWNNQRRKCWKCSNNKKAKNDCTEKIES